MLSKIQLALIAIGTSLSFWDIFNVPYIVNDASKMIGLSSSLILSAEMLGYFIGGSVNGYLASIKGRKFGMLLSMGLIALGSLLGFISTSLTELFLAEFIIGFGIEGEVATIPAYVSEMTEKNSRGKSVGITTLGGFLMSLIVGPIAVIVGDDWRLLFLPSLVISIFAFIYRTTLPESNLWIEKATKDAKIIFKLNKTVIIFFLIWFTSYFAGYSLFASPVFSLISLKGFSNTSLYYTYILYGDPIGVVIGSLLNDKIERKFSTFSANFLGGLIIMLMPIIGGIPFILVGFIAMFFQGFKFPTMYAYTAENFNTEIRSLSYGIVDGIGHLGGVIGPIVFSLLYSNNILFSFIVVGIVSMLSGIMIITKGIRTKGKSLQELEETILVKRN
ncbi:MFS transporter [Acidianus sulfidivorans JP7]|uniref:MFS transporter n=1 Tax=Acidianus sulfidivorans JP7 TaxID=619593 RepID=A0A2U9ILR9_9CREN|nr:MFS transporter [Acidianus sulfidivorans]AWR96961.1 MFS transporter [Acidianus sulfidivorans JP7]